MKNCMDKETALIKKNDTWKLVPRPRGKKSIGVKWIFKEKNNIKEEVEMYKARLVAKSCSQNHRIDCDEIFAPVVRLKIIQLIIVIVAQHRWRIYRMDVKSAFLNSFLEEEVYIEQHIGYEVKGHEDKLYSSSQKVQDGRLCKNSRE